MKNNRPIAGFATYIDACTYKDILVNISRTVGYRDKTSPDYTKKVRKTSFLRLPDNPVLQIRVLFADKIQ